MKDLQKEYELQMSEGKYFEGKAKDAFHKADMIKQVMNLMLQRAKAPEIVLVPEEPAVISDKYKDMSLAAAMLDTLRETPNLNGNEITEKIVANGFTSGSQSVKRDVFTGLFRLENKQHKIISDSSDGTKRYRLV